VQDQEIELSIGDSIQVGQHFVTILDVEDGVVSLRIEHQSDVQEVSLSGFNNGGFDELDEALRR